MGSCFSKNTTTTTSSSTLPTTTSHQSDLNNDQPLLKKELFVIKHRISHEIPDEEKTPNLLNPSSVGGRVRTPSCSKEQVDEILIQCGRLSRSNSAGAQNPSRRRRFSRSKRSFDFDLNLGLKNVDNDDADNDEDDEDEGLNHHNRRRRRERQGSRVSSPSSRRSSGERDFRQQRSGGGNGGRRISISPSRRSESPICRNSGGSAAVAVGPGAANGGSGARPMKMVPVPATDKRSTASGSGGGDDGGGERAVGGGVKRIHVKRNVAAAASPPRSRSPGARANLRIFRDDPSQERWRNEINSRAAERSPYKRKSLAEIDNNAARSVQPKMVAMVENLKLHENVTRTRISGLSRDLDMDQEPMFESDPSPPSYASLLLEDIHNFHRKNTNSATTAAATASPPFSLPACVSKACSIMEAVADLNSTTTTTGSSFFSDDKWRKNPTPIERCINKERFIESETVVNGGLTEPSLHNYVTMTRGGGGATEEQESSGGNSLSGSKKSPSGEPKSADPATRKCEMKPLGGLQSKLLDYPRKGIGRGRKTAYPTPEITTVASS